MHNYVFEFVGSGNGTIPKYQGTSIPHPNPYDVGLEVEQVLLESRENDNLPPSVHTQGTIDPHIGGFSREPRLRIDTGELTIAIMNTM